MLKKKIEYLALTTRDELRRHKTQWDSLEVKAEQRSAMLSYAWISNHFDYFVSPEQSWVCLVAILNNRLLAVLPLVLEERSWPAHHIIGRSTFGNHLNITDILCEQGSEKDVLPGLLNFAFDQYPRLGYIDLPRVPAASPTLDIQLSTSVSLVMSRTVNSYGYFLPVADDYPKYEQLLSRNFRSNLKKATNKLAKLDCVDFEFLSSDAELEKCLKRFCDIEKSGWKGRSGTAIGESDHLFAFYSAVLRDLDAIEVLEWHFLKSADHDLAGHMAFRLRDKLILWKLAYNESFSACSPGGQLMRETIRREVNNKKSSEIDLTTDQSWYRNWKLVKRPYFQIRVYNRHCSMSVMHLYIERIRNSARNSPFLRRVRDIMKHLVNFWSKD